MICKICLKDVFKDLFLVNDIKHQTTKKKFLIRKCKNCGVLISTENGKEVNGSLYYPNEYSAFSKVEKTRKNKDKIYPFNVVKGRLAWAKKLNIDTNTEVLDIGCGNGSNMLSLKSTYGCQIEGIEPSSKAVTEGVDLGANIYCGTLNDFTTNKQYDIIYLLHVIEHLDNPIKELKRILDYLKPEGKLIIGTPNTFSLERILFKKHWDGWDTPRHIYMFNPKNLKKLLIELGFNKIEVYYEIYSLFKRSSNNIFTSRDFNTPPSIIRGISTIMNRILSVFLPFVKFSGAVQIIATKTNKK